MFLRTDCVCEWFDVCAYAGVRINFILLWNCVLPIFIMYISSQQLKLEHYMCYSQC